MFCLGSFRNGHYMGSDYCFRLHPCLRPGCSSTGTLFCECLVSSGNFELEIQHLFALLIVAALQSLVTMSVHCVELLVNRSRDEQLWRKAMRQRHRKNAENSNSGSADIRISSFKAALTSWQTITLFAFKPVIHWMFGLGGI